MKVAALDEHNVFARPRASVVQRGPRPKRTRKKPETNSWIALDRLGMSEDERRNPAGERNLVMASVQSKTSLFKFAAPELRADFKWVESVVRKDWKAFEYVDDHLKDDRTIVLAAVKQSGRAMAFASERMRNDKEVNLSVLVNHLDDSVVCAESCRAITRLGTQRPEVLDWFGDNGACEAVVGALEQHPDEPRVLLQGCRAIATLCTTLDAVTSCAKPFTANQDRAGDAGACCAVFNAVRWAAAATAAAPSSASPFVPSSKASSVLDAAVRAGAALACSNDENRENICFEAGIEDDYVSPSAVPSAGLRQRRSLGEGANDDDDDSTLETISSPTDRGTSQAEGGEKEEFTGAAPAPPLPMTATAALASASGARRIEVLAVQEMLATAGGEAPPPSPSKYRVEAVKRRGLFPPVSSLRSARLSGSGGGSGGGIGGGSSRTRSRSGGSGGEAESGTTWPQYIAPVRGGGGGGGAVLDAVRGDGGNVVSVRKLLFKNVDAGLGIIESEEEKLFKTQKARPRLERPPNGKPSGFEHLSTAFCVTDA